MEFTVQVREGSGKQANKKIRREGTSPGIIYAKDKTPLSICVETKLARRFINMLQGATKIINLTIEGSTGSEQKRAILQDYQLSNYKRELLHMDFWEVSEETVVKSEVELNIIGTPKAAKFGGVMQTIRHSIPIKCQVRHLPDVINIDVSELFFGESIHVLDIKYPKGVTPIVTGRNFTLMTISGRSPETDADTDTSDEKEPEEA